MARQIERGSRAPFGPGQYSTKPRIDMEILSGFADPDEIEHEHQVDRPYRGSFARADDVEDDHRCLCSDECSCEDGKTCQICVTDADLMAFPELRKDNRVVIDPVPGKKGDYTVRLPLELAEAMELISAI